jgi:hypothetical protein
MTKSNFQASIPQTQDELRDRFVAKGLKNKLIAQYSCAVTDPWILGLDHWKNPVEVRKEKYKDHKTGKRVALIYWTKDRELIVNSLIDEGVRYVWNGTPATKHWSSYQSAL